MTSQIIPTNPTAGSATTSSVRENFRIADEEITQLQRSNIDAQDLTSGPISYNVTYPADPAFALVDGVRIAVRVNVTNSSIVTDLNVNGTGGLPIKSVDGESLSIGDLVANQYYELMLNAVVPASPYWACLNINKNVILSSLDVEGEITADLITLHPTGNAGEGGQVQFQREIDATVDWYIDAFGESNTTDLRFINTGTGTDIKPFQVMSTGIYVEGEALGNTVGDETIQAEFRSINANKSKLLIKDERWADGSDWNSASKVLQFEVDTSPHSYIASSTEGSGLRGIEIGTHDGAGAREKFFVGDADGGAYLFYNNVKKLQTSTDGIAITGNSTDTVISFLQGSTETPATDGFDIRTTWNESGNPSSFLDFRAKDDDADGFRWRFNNYVNPGVYHNFMTLTPDDNVVARDEGILKVNGAIEQEGDSYNLFVRNSTSPALYAQISESTGQIASFRYDSATAGAGNEVIGISHDRVDIHRSVHLGNEDKIICGSGGTGQLEIYEASNGNGYVQQTGEGNLVIQATDGYLYSDAYSVAYWDTNHIKLKYQNFDKLQTTSTGVLITGNTEGGWFRHDTDQVEGFDGSWNSFGRNGGSNVLYVQQGRNDTPIASFRRDNDNTGNTTAGSGVEVVGIKQNGIQALNYYSSDGTVGVSGTSYYGATLTIKNGLVVAVN